jgi:hypothetical protein
MKRYLLVGAVMGLAGIAGAPCGGVTVPLSDLNSVFMANSHYEDSYQWFVDGTGQLFQQGFWLRVGDMDPETELGDYYTSLTNPMPNIVKFAYHGHADFKVDVTYVLTGGTLGSGIADVMETVRITNTSSQWLEMAFIQYSDFELGGPGHPDAVWFPNANTVRQFDLGGTSELSETVVTPPAAHHEGGVDSYTLDRLRDGLPTTLNDLPAVGAGGMQGDVTWAYQWNPWISPGGSYIISKDKRLGIVPEPASLLLFGAGLLGIMIVRRRRKGD